MMDFDDDKEQYKVFAPPIRDKSLINGFNAILRRVEFNSGLAYGTLSDLNTVDKTAEEIKTSKQRSSCTGIIFNASSSDTPYLAAMYISFRISPAVASCCILCSSCSLSITIESSQSKLTSYFLPPFRLRQVNNDHTAQYLIFKKLCRKH